MPAVTRVGDNNTGHDACPPIALASGSPNVFVNGKAVGRVKDKYNPHGCPIHTPPHQDEIVSGAPNVFANGEAVARVGDPVSLGGAVAQGSTNVNVGNGGASLNVNGRSVSVLDFKLKCVEDVISSSPLFTDVDKIILALPNIAQNVSQSFEEKKDQQGWLYLVNMAKKWLTGKPEVVTSKSSITRRDQILNISWSWGYSYSKIQKAVSEFLSDTDDEYRIFNKKAQDSLIQILKDNKLLYSGATFDFLNTDKMSFKKNYFAYYPVDRDYLSKSGLQASLARCSIRALAKGYVTEDFNGLCVAVNEVGLFIYDIFQFE